MIGLRSENIVLFFVFLIVLIVLMAFSCTEPRISFILLILNIRECVHFQNFLYAGGSILL